MDFRVNDIDKGLIEQLQQGDKRAFRLLFEKYSNRLYHFSLKYLREKEDAEDLLHEVFLKIWEKRDSIRSNTSFQSYLFTIAYNDIRKRYLKKSREEKYIQVFAEEYILGSQMTDDQLDYLEFVKKIDELIEMLPPRRKKIFQLSYKEELKNREIANRLGLSEQFVKNQLTVSRKFIVGKIKEDSQFASMLLLSLFFGQSSD